MRRFSEDERVLLRAELERALAAPVPSYDSVTISQRVGELIARALTRPASFGDSGRRPSAPRNAT